MTFPKYEHGKNRVMFFSRGRGRGHAFPDIQLAREAERCGKCDVRMVSYSTGARTVEELGHSVIELDLPQNPPQTDITVLAGKLIGSLEPDVVVSHEEFAVAPVAKIFDKPVIFITDFFVEPSKQSMSSLRFADEIFFVDDESVFPEPLYLKGKVRYVGPILRDFQYTKADRVRARRELDLPGEAMVVAVLPGSWSEERTPSYELIMGAFDLLEEPKRLLWVAGSDIARIAERSAGRSDVRVVEFDPLIERIMVAADVAVTKTNRVSAIELFALGIPSISLYHGQNALDEARVVRIPTNVHRRADKIRAEDLADLMRRQSRLQASPRADLRERKAVKEIAAAIAKPRPRSTVVRALR